MVLYSFSEHLSNLKEVRCCCCHIGDYKILQSVPINRSALLILSVSWHILKGLLPPILWQHFTPWTLPLPVLVFSLHMFSLQRLWKSTYIILDCTVLSAWLCTVKDKSHVKKNWWKHLAQQIIQLPFISVAWVSVWAVQWHDICLSP